MRRNPVAEALMTVREVAEEAGVCERTVRRWIAAGHLRALRLGPAGRVVRIHPRDWADFLRDA